jgi:hypothetical protein
MTIEIITEDKEITVLEGGDKFTEDKEITVLEGGDKFKGNLEIGKIFKDSLGKANDIVEITDGLLNLPEFKYVVICPPTGINYYYDEEEGYYKQVSEDYIERLIDKTLLRFDIKLNYNKIRSLYKHLTLKKGVEESDTRNPNYVCFTNGLFHLSTQNLIPHTPDIFCTETLGYPYLKNCPIDNFMEYLDKLCSYQEHKKTFVRSWLSLLLHNYCYTQTFLVIIRPGGSRKSIFEMICKALVKDRNTITTFFSSMFGNSFIVLRIPFAKR